ncbi:MULTISPECIES: BglG family transcription antiterminator [unclassified Thermoactinomyces]|jgi:transcriptional antiterminator/mannitol/fructose-specific phosphotransferase system IIA component (Ntr-type)|uniref:BglG family transcription antiterminator n=1 Tax=unclassified Thermoactinomyces TaxID=2634588 RepID=UPI0018DEBFB8|nr:MULTISPECIES: BglG family transcription antiterminator [unclassified Thermoactinomyces]MBH8605763.1 BglG family transcription antiterminator [Thermoactinomyces sp. CICC 10522]MBH8607944.1 BglG family transcription antiterminator [Thermoactinomyces sp. CICC 10521]
MLLDERCLKLLQEIVTRPDSSWNQLQQNLRLSRRQLAYALDKINAWLTCEKLPEIEYRRREGFVFPPVLKEKVQSMLSPVQREEYVWSSRERARLILLSLLTTKETWSLIHASSFLQVSRNTALSDIKEAKRIAAQAGVDLIYSRMEGYLLTGPEWQQRKLMRWLVLHALEQKNGEVLLTKVLEQDREVPYSGVRSCLERVERDLQVRYTDEHLLQLTYMLQFLGKRLERKCLICWDEAEWEEIARTEEYRVSRHLLGELAPDGLSEEAFRTEQAYIALQLLVTNVFSQKEKPMQEIAAAMVGEFERIACISLAEKDHLASLIAMHLYSAYYRIKYDLEMQNPLLDVILRENEALHYLVKKCVIPFQNRVGKPVPEGEMAYFTMHFGGWLRRQGLELTSRPKAVVVCPNGIAISNLLTHVLRELFPDILFLDVLTVRQFFSGRIKCDIVFSTVYLRTDCKLFIVKPILSWEEKARLRSEVSREIYGFPANREQLVKVMDVIEQYADIHDRAGLSKALASLFAPNHFTPPFKKESKKPMLNELITEQTIQLRTRAADWKEAIRLAAKPLIDSGSIEERYVTAMIESINQLGPYVVLAPKVAIPHARPEHGVNQLSMSFLRLREAVLFPQNKAVHLIFVLAAADNESHLLALAQLSELLAKEEEIERLIQAETTEEVMNMINHYSKGDMQR